MTQEKLIISTGSLNQQSLAGQVAVVTGAGGGIGFEAARALAWLGASVIVAEIDTTSGKTSAEQINREMGTNVVTFIRTDVGDQRSVNHLARQVLRAVRICWR